MPASATTTFFVTAQYVKKNSIINDNVDEEVINSSIRIASDKYIHPVLGSRLYSTLGAAVSNGSYSGSYLTLVNGYVVPALLHWSIYECMPYMTFKFRNTSISRQNTPNSQPADLAELSYLRDDVRKTAQYYSERLVSYLTANSSSIPEYQAATTADDLSPNRAGYFAGIFIPRQRYHDDCCPNCHCTECNCY